MVFKAQQLSYTNAESLFTYFDLGSSKAANECLVLFKGIGSSAEPLEKKF